MSWEFFVGQKVVCVDDDRHEEWPGNSLNGSLDGLVRDQIYTVRALSVCRDGSEGLHLHEILRGDSQVPFRASRFRPIDSKSISLFRSIAQGVTDGKPVVPDESMPVDEPAMPEFVGRPLLQGRQ